MADKNYIVIPTAKGLLDCFNIRKNNYSSESICHLVTNKSINIPSLYLIFSFIYHNCKQDASLYTFKFADLRAYRGHSNSKKGFDLKSELLKLNDIKCCWKDMDLNNFVDITIDGRDLIVESEYIFNVLRIMNDTTKLNHKAAFTNIVNRSILLQRNHSAVEITVEICKLIERRGKLIEGESAHIAVETLIGRCPALFQKINNATTNSRKNQILNEDIKKARDLLQEHTRIYQVFNDFNIILPKQIKVNTQQKIEIIHNGRTYK